MDANLRAGPNRKRQRRAKTVDGQDPLIELPHSIEGEKGVLGCIILSPAECIPQCKAVLQNSGAFYDLRCRRTYEAIMSLDGKGATIDILTLQQHLRDDGELDDAGGLPFLVGLTDVPSAANLPYYLSLVSERAALRDSIQTCTSIVERAYNHDGDMAQFSSELERGLQRLMAATRFGESAIVGPAKSFEELCSIDTQRDPNCLLGFRPDGTTSRYLCRGGSGWIIGPSGIGKSSLAVMMAVHWAAGLAIFGIRPARPLRITIIQAENDDGDMAEMARGVEDGLADGFITAEQRDAIRTNLKVRTEGSRTGREFTRWLEKVIRADRADIVLLDPFLSFAGIDVSKQEQCSQFLRTWLNPVLHVTGAAVLGMHHTGKPKPQKGQRPMTALEQAYDGLGSSELVNWARLLMNLRECADGIFELKLTKRGDRAWARHPDSDENAPPARSIWLRQGQGRIWWEQIPPPEKSEPTGSEEREGKAKGGKPSKIDRVLAIGLGPLLDALTEPVGKNELARRIEQFAAKASVDVSRPTAKRIVEHLVEETKALKKVEGGYVSARV